MIRETPLERRRKSRAAEARTRRFALVVVFAVVAVLVPAPSSMAQSGGFQVHGGRLLDAGGNDIVLRGVNHPHAWFPGQLGSLADIKSAGANAVRVVLSTGARFDATSTREVTLVIDECMKTRLICVLEIHDTTGFGEVAGAVSLDAAVDYWIANEPAVRGHESHVILNIGNEPFGNVASGDWTQSTIDAVQRLRTAGLTHALMVDAPNWGQDWTFTMRDNAQLVFDSDPQGNLIFDVHMYGVFEDEADVRAYIESFVVRELPLVIGEFGPTHTDGDPDEDVILAWAEAYGIGFFGWSWSGNTVPVAALNMVEAFDASRRTNWGERLISGDHGLRSTAAEAPVYGGPVTQPPPRSIASRAQTDVQMQVIHDRAEAEHGTLNGLGFSVIGAGFSGPGYVDGLDHAGDSVEVSVFVDSAGSYDLVIGYRARFGHKTQSLYVNRRYVDDVRFAASEQFTTVAYRAAELEAGENTVMLLRDWGWIDVDYVQVQSDGATQ